MSRSATCQAVARAALGAPAKRAGGELLWCCPNHNDQHPSLSVNPGKDTWLCGPCGASGTAWQLAAFLAGASPDDKPAVIAWLKGKGLVNGAKRKGKADGSCVATYVYTNADGNPVARKLRFEPGANGRPKDFSWQRFEGGQWLDGLGGLKPPLYRLTEIKTSDWVLLTEGEKDADAGVKLSLPTSTSGGTGSWREDHSEALRGKGVVIIADADEPGRVHAEKVAVSLYRKAAFVKVVGIPGSKDLSEAIEKEMPREALLALFEEAREWKPATGAEILDAVLAFVRRYLSLTESQARAVVLWAAHTHAFEAADTTPYLAVNSAEKQSGKTRLLEVLRFLVSDAWFTGRVTAAVLIRKIDAQQPTLLLDESDAAFRSGEEYSETLRAVLNAGYRRGGAASACVGQSANISYQDFSTFCPKAIAGIGRLPDTVADRSIQIRLKRARRGEVERFRERLAESEGGELKARLAAWAQTNVETLRNARPEIPCELSDRQADCCEPLLALADAVGGEWPKSARRALIELCAGAQADDDSVGVKLLADIKRQFHPHDDDGNPLPSVERITSCDLAQALGSMEDRPWAEWKSGKPITQPQLARLLWRFDIRPKTVRVPDGRRLKGYEQADFEESWTLYLPKDSPHPPSTPLSSRDTVTTRENSGRNANFEAVTPNSCHASKNAVPPSKNAPCHGVTASKGVPKAEEAEIRILFADVPA